VSNFSDFIGGGGSASYPTIFLSKSQTWVPPQDGNIMIHVIGAGGSGTATNVSDYSSGAAGGYCKKNSLAVTTSGSFTVVIGAGGASVRNTTASNAGGNTTVAGTGLGSTLTANGGGGGVSGDNSTGGTASGGDVNNTGGAGTYQGGGGAVGLAGTGNAGLNSNGNYTGGDCDVVGDFWSSSFGQLAGDIGTSGVYYNTNAQLSPAHQPFPAGPLAGGGYSRTDRTTQYGYTKGGDATIGGGGGSNDNSMGGSYAFSGRGGEGIVVIQYIP
jgi:hypothetical protein